MRRQLTWALAAAIAIAMVLAGGALAAKPTVVRVGNLIMRLNGDLSRTVLQKQKLTPVGFHTKGSLATADGSQLPPLKEVITDVDDDIAVDVSGLPVCRRGQLVAQESRKVRKACAGALLGTGSGSVRVAFPEQPPFDSTGPLLLFNGGAKGGVTTLYVHTYVNVPAPTAVVTTVKITKEHRGPYGTRFSVAVPVIAGGHAAVTHFELATLEGREHSFLYARCSDGNILAYVQFKFLDGSAIEGGIVRPCTVAPARLLAASLEEAGPSREEYAAAVEPICKANTEASGRILDGVKAEVKRDELKPAAAQFAKAATALRKTLTQLRVVPQPAADTAKLSRWLGFVKREAELFQAIAEKLKAGDKVGAQAMAIRLNNNANLANNAVLGFDFDHCSADPSKFT